MKKIMLLPLALVAIVGGAYAFKVRGINICFIATFGEMERVIFHV
jgi:hypothetical protein